MKRGLLFMLLVAFSFKMQAQSVTYSIQAHQDDWQLFMQSTVISDMSAGGKVVFITLTAGDAGAGALGYGSPIPYYLAREKGSVYSAKFAADLNGQVPLANPDSVRIAVNGHSIIKYVYKNTVNYFFRLPDGGIPGDGNSLTGFKTLKKLKNGDISSISSVDGIVTFSSWLDLTNTIKKIITVERGADNQVWINTASLDTAGANAGDHSDHIYTSIAAQEAVKDSLWVGINEYVDYKSPNFPSNLTVQQHAVGTALFAVTNWGLLASKYNAPFDIGHKLWLPVDRLVVKRQPAGFAVN